MFPGFVSFNTGNMSFSFGGLLSPIFLLIQYLPRLVRWFHSFIMNGQNRQTANAERQTTDNNEEGDGTIVDNTGALYVILLIIVLIVVTV